jgi:hypothetical protein
VQYTRRIVLKNILILLLGLIFIITGCNNQSSETEEIAKIYLEKKGYEVISYEGESSIVFSKSQLLELPGEQIWGVQYVEPDNYLNKEIETASFMVKNHPLDNMYDMGKTNLTVYIFNQEVIGGWSLPHSKERLVGGFYSLDGKTIEEIHGDWQKWRENWEDKYRTK